MNNHLTRCLSLLAIGGALAVPSMSAKQGAPHSVTVENNYSNVTLSWKSPASPKTLQWHDGEDYNGDSGTSLDPQKPVTLYVGSLFTASDLASWVGEKVKSITIFQYRQVHKATVLVYEDGEVVAQADADPAKYEKNTFLEVALPNEVPIVAGKNYIFAVKFVSGSNMDFVAIKDRASDAPGKGDLMSTDGINWTATGAGEYLITANLANDVDEAPTAYNIYRGDEKLNDSPYVLTTFFVNDEAEGTHEYSVAAIYADGEIKSAPVSLDVRSYSSYFPTVTPLSSKVDNLNVAIEWAEPLLGGDELTWSNKELGIGIGGTASSNTKVWVKNEFTASDLVAYAGSSITAINFMFKEAVVSGVTMFIYRDGSLVWSEAVPEETVAGIAAEEWTKFTLSEPYELLPGHSYAYGLYVLHTPKAHPIGVDTGVIIDGKANSFSTSSPNSTNFLNSKPSWKTLKSGGIEGNWMMTADLSNAPASLSAPVYDIYRNGTLVAGDLGTTSVNDEVADLGTYTYSIVAKAAGRESEPVDVTVDVALPPAYAAPLIENYSLDAETREVSIQWNMDKELSHCGEPAYLASFDEEMSLMWGTQFTAAELADYAGYSICKLRFMIGEAIGDFKIGVYTKTGQALSEIDIPASAIQPQAIYTVNLPTSVLIEGDQDLILAYTGTIPAEAGGIVIDGGPLVDGGSRVSFTSGATWMNLGTINPTYNNYNIFISAMVSELGDAPAETSPAADRSVELTKMPVMKADTEYGVETTATVKSSSSPAMRKAPKTVGFNIYRNGVKIGEVEGYTFTEKLDSYGLFTYNVTARFDNGWESKPSEDAVLRNTIAQKAVGPFALTGEVSGTSLALNWQSPDKASVLTYATGDTDLGLGMTGSGTRSSYCVIKMPASELESNVGNKISHIRFGLYSTELYSAAVVVMYGENIIYEQSVPVSDLVVGLNDIRLNEPVEIPEGTDVYVGYFVTYANGIKPLSMDESAANAGFGDLISSNATPGYWYSLKDKFNMDHNWRIYAIVSTPDFEVPLRSSAKVDGDVPAITYNVYCDGVKIAEGVEAENYIVADAKSGRYYVTAVQDETESGESNVVVYTASSGVVEIVGDNEAGLVYDKASEVVSMASDGEIVVYSVSGSVAASASGSEVSVAHLLPGVYMVVAKTADGISSLKIVK